MPAAEILSLAESHSMSIQVLALALAALTRDGGAMMPAETLSLAETPAMSHLG